MTTRREFLTTSLAVPAALAAGLGVPTAAAQGRRLAATPACADPAEPTHRQTEGPYFTPGSPHRTSLLEPGVRGTRIVVAGRVLSIDCKPVARALVDVWHADDAGDYDNRGFRFRGHHFTDEAGGYRFETIVPGAYSGRTRHYHVKVRPADPC